MSDDDRRELNLKAGRLIKNQGISIYITENEYEELRAVGFVGYAEYYLRESYDESELRNTAVVEIYEELLGIDSKLGTTTETTIETEQLFAYVAQSVRMDLFKVIVIFVSRN